MPPKTALLKLGTRRSYYVCNSCLASLSIQQPNQIPARPYASASKRQARVSFESENTRSEKPPKAPPEKPYTVNYFEKDETGQVRQLPVGDDADDVNMADIEALEANALAKAEKLDATLQVLNRKFDFVERILQRHGPKGALEAYRKALETYDEVSGCAPIPLLPGPIEGTGLSKAGVYKINKVLNRLNNSIERSTILLNQNKLDHQHLSQTWSYFTQARSVIYSPQRLVPKNTWDNLWAIFSWESEENPQRMAHIRGLCQAMMHAGVPLSEKQQLLQIESAYLEGYPAVAIENWKRLRPELGNNATYAMTFWELGVRLWSKQGDIERAEVSCQAVLDRASPSTPADSRVLLHLIKAYASKPDHAVAEKGFNLYRRMRDLATHIDQPMKIDDYDNVISIFLTTGHTDYAMYAFTDMMYAGAVNLYGKQKLPSPVKNHFFFGKWLKRLMGAGDLDGAYQVLVYMQANGVMASAVHVNGLIGAWLRSRTAENRKKAEQLAWSMIHARKAFVDLRQRERHMMEWPLRLYDGRPNDPNHKGDVLDYKMVPRASAETFILIAENYRERGLFGRLEKLFVAYKECEIGGDAMMMNELIMAAVAQGKSERARELYNMMVHDYNIVPNVDTYAILFKSLPINSLRAREGTQMVPEVTAESRALARGLFKDMVTWTWLYQERRRTRYGEMSEEQVKLILHTFRKCGDWAGVIVALVCFRDLMRFKITRNVLLEMIAEHEGIDRPSPRTSKIVIITTMRLQALIDNVKKKEQQQQAEEGAAVETEPAKDSNEIKDPSMLYNILLEYYYRKAEKDYHHTWYFRKIFQDAQEEMGTTTVVALDPPTGVGVDDSSVLEEDEQQVVGVDGDMYKKT